MRTKGKTGVLGLLLCLAAGRAASAELRFDQPQYTVLQGRTFRARLYLDMNESAPGRQLPATGLFSVGAKAVFNSARATVAGTGAVQLAPGVDHNGVGGPGVKEVGPGYAGVAGVVPFGATQGSYDPLVLTVDVTATASGTFALTPALFYGDTRANFIDYLGTVLDGQITHLVPSTVTVPPGPAWWYEWDVIKQTSQTNDYAAVTQGQLKWIATQAYRALTNEYGGVSAAVSNCVASLTHQNNYKAVNVGQVKHVAKPFYDWLISRGKAAGYPWTGGASANDFAVANVGQVKRVFSFPIP